MQSTRANGRQQVQVLRYCGTAFTIRLNTHSSKAPHVCVTFLFIFSWQFLDALCFWPIFTYSLHSRISSLKVPANCVLLLGWLAVVLPCSESWIHLRLDLVEFFIWRKNRPPIRDSHSLLRELDNCLACLLVVTDVCGCVCGFHIQWLIII